MYLASNNGYQKQSVLPTGHTAGAPEDAPDTACGSTSATRPLGMARPPTNLRAQPLSDNQPLMDWFLALPAPRMLMYGEQNNTLSYLDRLQENSIELAEIPQSGHFPMYANAPEMWRRINTFVRAEPKPERVRDST